MLDDDDGVGFKLVVTVVDCGVLDVTVVVGKLNENVLTEKESETLEVVSVIDVTDEGVCPEDSEV